MYSLIFFQGVIVTPSISVYLSDPLLIIAQKLLKCAFKLIIMHKFKKNE